MGARLDGKSGSALRLARFGCLLLFTAIFFRTAVCSAQSLPKVDKTPDRNTGPSIFLSEYQAAVKAWDEGARDRANEQFKQIKRDGEKRGYAGFPQFSDLLLDWAKAQRDKGDIDAARSLAEQARMLSPGDSLISFRAAILFAQGASQFAALAPLLVSAVSESPRIGAGLFGHFLLIALIAATLSLFFVAVMQLVGSRRLLVELALAPERRSRFRGFITLIVLFVVLVAPLWSGIFLSLAVWSLILGSTARRARWLLSLTGALVVGWSLILPMVQRLDTQVRSPVSGAVERINLRQFEALDGDVLARSIGRNADNRLFFTLAVSSLLNADYETAAKQFAAIAASADLGTELWKSSILNSAAAKLFLHDAKGADEILSDLEKQTGITFEIAADLAIAKLQQLDMAEHRHYYQRAVELDADRVHSIEAGNEEALPVQFITLNRKALFGRLFASTVEPPEAFAAQRSSRERVLKMASPFSSERATLLFGVALMALGVVLAEQRAKPRRQRWRTLQLESQRPSRVWFVIPAGGYAVGEKPISGFLLLTILIGLGLAAFEQPVALLSTVGLKTNLQILFFDLAALAAAASLLLPLLSLRRGKSE